MKRLICAVLTKFDDKGNLVLDDEYLRFLKALRDGGVDCLMVAGTNGEFHVMNVDERKTLLEFVLDSIGNEMEIIAHIGTTNLRDTLKLGDHALSRGVEVLSVVAPYYFKYDGEALVNYFVEVARTLPEAKIILYNIPSFTRNRIELEHILKVKEKADNIVGIKDSDARPWIAMKLKETIGENFMVYGGFDDYIVSYLSLGSDGQVSGTSNVFPKLMKNIIKSFEKGDSEKLVKLYKILTKVIGKVSGHKAFVAANKFALRVLGYDVGYPRSPNRCLTETERAEIEEFVREVKEWSI